MASKNNYRKFVCKIKVSLLQKIKLFLFKNNILIHYQISLPISYKIKAHCKSKFLYLWKITPKTPNCVCPTGIRFFRFWYRDLK